MEQSVHDAGEAASSQLQTILNSDHIEELKRLQLLTLGRLEDSNAVLSHYNDFSERSFTAVAADMNKNTRTLKAMKADLDYIFKRIRIIKNKISSRYPDAFKDSSEDHRPNLEQPKTT